MPNKRDPQTICGEMEVATLRALANAMEALIHSKNVTGNGFVADHCDNAMQELTKAMSLVIGE